MSVARQVLLAQGVYYAATGVWPLLHMRSFLAVTGPKRDLWLVKTVGLLIAAIGTALVVASLQQREPGNDVIVLAAGSALALGCVDVVYSVKRVISYAYLLDAAAEAALLWLWGYTVVGALL